MIGYEKYNSISDQWEYYSLKNSSSSNGYGEPQSTFDADLAIMALSKRQAEYDKAVDKVKNFGNSLGKMQLDFSNQIENIKLRNEYNRLFNQNIDNFIETNYKMIRTPAKHSIVLDRFYSLIARTYNQAVNNLKESQKYNTTFNYNNSSNNVLYTTVIKSDIVVDPKLRNKPSPSGDVIYMPKLGEKADVIVKVDETYYKVKVGGYYGFISKSFLK